MQAGEDATATARTAAVAVPTPPAGIAPESVVVGTAAARTQS